MAQSDKQHRSRTLSIVHPSILLLSPANQTRTVRFLPYFSSLLYSSPESHFACEIQEANNIPALEKASMGLRAKTKKLMRKLSGRDDSKQEEVMQLQPVALAGASKRSNMSTSRLCSSFAMTISMEDLSETRRKALSDGGVSWTQCETCARSFVIYASQYKDFCSLDCKTASLYRLSFS